ncbi:YueI family protein [Lentilactobacillus kisonensis]|uniref:DUF1694 domain-containing protein n=1 Tax=Lentilactobacillus kisonensis F0435 TaxID=797516 RepID=H1LEB0_9LACO|nr:YueI family protein [Lentilactobacillus kisonensis]EHO52606.1 hypothetical protein HMPREF9104_00936 [Lentilactobacillus kisonensis F0435]
MANDSEDYIKQHMFGNPQLKPDEKRAFLGNFRERVALALTISQLRQSETTAMVEKVITNYPEYRMYLNGKMDDTLIEDYMGMAIDHHYQFTVLVQNGVRVATHTGPNDFGLVIASPNEKIKRRILL